MKATKTKISGNKFLYNSSEVGGTGDVYISVELNENPESEINESHVVLSLFDGENASIRDVNKENARRWIKNTVEEHERQIMLLKQIDGELDDTVKESVEFFNELVSQ